MQVVEDIENAQKAADWKRFGELHAENVVLHSPDNAVPLKGRDAVVGWYKGFFTAFPDMTPTRLVAITQGEWVAAEYRITGTHKGALKGPAGTIPGGAYTLQGGGDGYYYSTFSAGGLPAGDYTLVATRNGDQIANTVFTRGG